MKKKANVFKPGKNQAVRLPKAFNTRETQFYIRRLASSILLTPKTSFWEIVEQGLAEFSDDFMKDGRNQPPIEQRDSF